MMARQPLAIGTAGNFTERHHPDKPTGAKWQAYCTFRDLDGKTRQIERWAETKTKVRAALNEAIRDRQTPGSYAGALTAQSRFSAAAEQWIPRIERNRAPRTIQAYRWVLSHHVLPALGELRLMECTAGRLDDYMDALDERGLSANTRRNIKSVVSGVLGFAVRHKALTENPARHMSRIEDKGRRRVRALAPDELADFLARLDDLRCGHHLDAERAVADGCRMCAAQRRTLPDMVRFMLGTGARIGECLAVRWCDLELDATPPLALLGPTLVRVPGEGLRRQQDGKTKAATRTIALPGSLATMLTVRRPADASDGDPVFPSASYTWWDPANAQDALRKARARTGFDWVTSHVFRKTAATVLDDAGLSARQIADQLGHARPSLTQDVYMGRGTLNPAAATALDEAYRAGR